MRPEFVERIPPCNATCPAGENIQLWLSLSKEGKFREAWEVMVKDNPFPAIMGRVCYHTCEKTCNREQFDGAVNINLIERSIGDVAIANSWSFEKQNPDSGKKVLIVGAGPSGLTAAYFLRQMGHDVTVYEDHSKPGGMMRYGVPRYRLPAAIMDAEINRIADLGVKIICGRKISSISAEMENFDAVYVSTGASKAAKSNIEIKKNSNVFDAIDLFRKLEDESANAVNLGKRVIVYGGGNSAIDAARTALRLGAESVKIVYRRTVHTMPAHDIEINEALAEGVEILYLRTINCIDGDKVLIDKMDFDEESNILSKSGEIEILYADSVILAIGQSMDEHIWRGMDAVKISEKGLVEIDKNMMTGADGVFAGGDIVFGKRTVTHAIGHGKKAAKFIDANLRGVEFIPIIKHEMAGFKKLNTVYFKKNAKVNVSRLGDLSFSEKDVSYSNENIVVESARCFSCGNCFHCDNCYGYCPDNAIIKHPDGSLEINYDYCKGCGMCAAECPCGSIKMVSEDK
jgi:2-oxoacid:acceptor oxidoreductase delta subunit (pyruvate/2-ketoisovalerate family)